MKKSFRPSRPSRPAGSSAPRRSSGIKISNTPRPSSPHFSAPSGGMDASGKKDGFGGSPGVFNNQQDGFSKKQSGFGNRWSSGNRRTPLIVTLVVVACCLLSLCVLGIYLATTGFFNQFLG